MNKELDDLEEDRRNLVKRLEESETEASIHWDRFAKEIREEYDETESKVRNFFKK